MIYVIDFGSQTAYLIVRRLKELGSPGLLVPPKSAFAKASVDKPQGIIFSGGPASVYEKNAPTIDPKIFDLGIPILGICYGLQLTAHLLGGKVIPGKKEYGPAQLRMMNNELRIMNELPNEFTVWMSHGDEVASMPEEFKKLGSTNHVPFAFVANEPRKIYGLQFHPEVEHTENGIQILKNFIDICSSLVILGSGATPESVRHTQEKLDSGQARMTKNIVDEIKENIKKMVGEAYVIGAVSGGVDSTVAGVLTAKAIGERFIPIFVDNGLMREGTREHVGKIFTKHSSKPIVVNAVGEMLERLKKITDPEKKRKIIGAFYIEIFEKETEKILSFGRDVQFLMQGTIYSDVIESKGTKHASKIKSHHNVGGLPKKMQLKLLEPLRFFFKDEVREIGKKLDLPDEFIYKQPFPGPGYAVRIRGEVTKERLEKEKIADKIVLEELESAGLLRKVFISFPVMTGEYSTAVKGDGRFFGEVIALRVVQSLDVMTAKWAHLPYDVLQKISSRIVNEVPGISRVVYDITTKPPATMEWE